ncbi:MAG: aminotransferase class IV [Clostridiales bacterium]|nr:aminotransferase class IV [Clostridiales bacterium]
MINRIHQMYWLSGDVKADDNTLNFENPPVYEVIRLMEGIPLFFEAHMERLEHSLELVGYPSNFHKKDYYEAIRKLVESTGIMNNNIRLEVGRSVHGIDHSILYFVKSSYPIPVEYNRGVDVMTTEVVRENPHAKVFYEGYVNKIAELRQKEQVYEVLLHNSEGILSEGSRSNLFFIKDERLISAKSETILMGITREKLIGILGDLKIELVERDIHISELEDFEACFISGTSIHILPIKKIDNITYSSAEHPIIKRMTEAFRGVVFQDIQKTRRQYHND